MTFSPRMNTVQAALCVLEPLQVSHAPAMFEVLSDPALYEFEGAPPPSLQALADGYQRRSSRRSPDGREQWLNWVVRLPGGALAGYVQATVLETGASYVAYELGSRHWRQGIGRDAVGAMLQELALHHGVHTFVAVLKRANFRSMGLLRHLGFGPGDPVEAARYGVEADEALMVKPAAPGAGSGVNAAASGGGR